MNSRVTAILCLFFLAVSARPKEKKTTLEDIERDYSTTKQRSRLAPPPIDTPVQSPTQYGFVPVKTIDNYAQQQPRLTYFPNSYITRPSQAAQSQAVETAQRYTTAKFVGQPVQYTQQLSQPQQYAQQVSQPQQNDYQSYENVQYVTDNGLGNGQYYTPQYYYVNTQYPAPSTSIQTVVDPKGGFQYVMYVPTYVPSASSADPQIPASSYSSPAQESSYSPPESPATDSYQTQQNYYQPPTETVIKREPKSLLDSYVPSYLQLQYYNQQAQQNSVQESVLKAPRAKGTYKQPVRYSYKVKS